MKTAKLTCLIAGMVVVSSLNGFSQDLANFSSSLAGKYPGLFVISNDGVPGAGSPRMFIRGIGSYAQGLDVNSLKFYVDGFEVKADYVNYLNAEEIESVKVLKNASDLAQYGMNGAEGVLLITTKKGTESKPVISFSTKTGIQTPINVAKPLGSYDYANLYNQALSNDAGEWAPYYDEDAMDAYYYGEGVDVNWYDEVYKKAGSYYDAVLSMRGGSMLAKYSVVLDYANQQGLLNVKNSDRTKNVSFVKYGLRTNIDMKLNNVLTVGVNIGGRLEDRFRPNYSVYALAENIARYPSNIYPIYDELSTDPICNYSGTATHPDNPVASLRGSGWTTSRTKLLQANFRFHEDLGSILEGLYLEQGFSFYSKTIGNTAKTSTYTRYYNGVAQTADVSTYLRSQGYWSSGKERWLQGNATAGYSQTFGKHEIKANLSAHISDYAGAGSNFYDWRFRYVNFSGSAVDLIDDIYELGLGFSYFGSDAYAPGRNFIFYPTVSFAYLASEALKIRSSLGMTGSSEAIVDIDGFYTNGRFLYQQYYNWGAGFITGFGPGFGGGDGSMSRYFLANPDVTAERSVKFNAGADANLMGGKLLLTGDIFVDYRSGILTQDNYIPEYYGNALYYANIGKMLNAGFEAAFVFSDRVDNLNYSVFGNMTIARNTVIDMGETAPKYKYNAATGHPYGSRMGLECIGFYDIDDFDDGELSEDLPLPLFGAVQPGDLKYKDQDGDGYIDETDIILIGAPSYPMATITLGSELSFGKWDFSAVLRGTFGSTVNLLDYIAWKPFLNYSTAYPWAKDAWCYIEDEGIDHRAGASFPRLTTKQNDNNYRSSSFWIKNNNYLRLANLEVGYSLSNFRVYVNANNVLTLSSLLWKYKMDPETVDYLYPATKSFNIGLQMKF